MSNHKKTSSALMNLILPSTLIVSTLTGSAGMSTSFAQDPNENCERSDRPGNCCDGLYPDDTCSDEIQEAARKKREQMQSSIPVPPKPSIPNKEELLPSVTSKASAPKETHFYPTTGTIPSANPTPVSPDKTHLPTTPPRTPSTPSSSPQGQEELLSTKLAPPSYRTSFYHTLSSTNQPLPIDMPTFMENYGMQNSVITQYYQPIIETRWTNLYQDLITTHFSLPHRNSMTLHQILLDVRKTGISQSIQFHGYLLSITPTTTQVQIKNFLLPILCTHLFSHYTYYQQHHLPVVQKVLHNLSLSLSVVDSHL